ncbi:hypothetical protein PAPYR_7149 [Paratrimastix pyriformis]|uniref:Uncharacterized protein n=1 Tax=Paratrimastix pyriformis TaxID=342808 RepID=A0ABQ8UF19_9EUKA|nr:hypothetical protein PAPYR_7149 [Paratrimastix pyriformis]
MFALRMGLEGRHLEKRSQINKVVASAEIVAAPSGIKYQDTTREMYLTNVRRVLSRLPKEYRTKEFFKATDQNFDGRVSEMRKYKEFYGRLLSELKDTELRQER